MSALPLTWPGPLFFFVMAMGIAVLAYIVHRWEWLSGGIATLGSLALGWIACRLLLDKPISVFGHTLVLGASYQLGEHEWALTTFATAVLALILIVAGLTFLLSLVTSQGWSFYPFGLSVLGVLVLAVTDQQYLYRVLFLWMAANLAAFVLSGGRPGATMGAFRFLALTTVAVIPLLSLQRYLVPDIDAQGIQVASILSVIGFSILFMMPPFHGQLVAASAHAAPMTPTFILSVFPLVTFYILAMLGQAWPVLLQDGFFFDVCRWLGTGAVALGGIAAMGQRRWGALIGYAILVDWGAGLVALGQGTHTGLFLAAQMLVWRALSLLLTGASMSALFQATGKRDDLEHCGGLLYRRPINLLILVIGLFSFAGFPLTPGAIARWPLILDLLVSDPSTAWVMLLAGAGISIGTLGGLRACVAHPQTDSSQWPKDRAREMISLAFGLFTLWIVGWLFLHSALWVETMQRVLSEFTFLPG